MHHHFGVLAKSSCGQKDVPMTAYEPSVKCFRCKAALYLYHKVFPKEGRR